MKLIDIHNLSWQGY